MHVDPSRFNLDAMVELSGNSGQLPCSFRPNLGMEWLGSC